MVIFCLYSKIYIYIIYICENWFHWNLELFLWWEILSVHRENWFHWNFGLFSGAKNKAYVRFGKVFFSQKQAMEHRFASQFVCPKIPTFPKNPPPQQLPKVPKVFRRLPARKKVRSFKKTPVPLMVMTVQMVDYAKILRKYSLIYNWSMYVCIRCLEKVTKISLPNLGLIWWCTMVERKNNRKHTKGIGVVVFLLLSQKN